MSRKDSSSQAARAPKWWQPETPPPEPLARQSISNGQVGKYPGPPTAQAHLLPPTSCHDGYAVHQSLNDTSPSQEAPRSTKRTPKNHFSSRKSPHFTQLCPSPSSISTSSLSQQCTRRPLLSSSCSAAWPRQPRSAAAKASTFARPYKPKTAASSPRLSARLSSSPAWMDSRHSSPATEAVAREMLPTCRLVTTGSFSTGR